MGSRSPRSYAPLGPSPLLTVASLGERCARRRHEIRAAAPPNTRLKLSAPVVYGRIPFVINPVRRRSLSAIR